MIEFIASAHDASAHDEQFNETAAVTVSFNTPAGIRAGDLMFVVLQYYPTHGGDAGWTAPAGWTLLYSETYPGSGAGQTHVYYLYANASEPSSYSFSSASSLPYIARGSLDMVMYRGVVRDTTYDPINYPFGFWSPTAGETFHTETWNAYEFQTQQQVTPMGSVVAGCCEVVVLTAWTEGTVTPLVDDDVDPLTNIRFKNSYSYTDESPQYVYLNCQCVDTTYAAATDPFTTLTFRYGTDVPPTGNTLQLLLEPIDADAGPTVGTDASIGGGGSAAPRSANGAGGPLGAAGAGSDNPDFDSYKAKLMRHLLPPPYDARYRTILGKVLTVVGNSDNEIGGLYGAEDFLPDGEP